MSHRKAMCFAAVLCLAAAASHAQNADSASALSKLTNFPTKLFGKVDRQATTFENQLTRQTERYLRRMARKEEKLRAAMYKSDSVKAAALYPEDPKQQYAAVMQKFRQDSSKVFTSMGPEYLGRLDSLQVTLAFLNKNPGLLNANPALQEKMQGAMGNLQQLQGKLQAADAVGQFIQSRNTQIQQTLSSYSHLPAGLTSAGAGYKQQAYYYADQVRTYRTMLNDPGKTEQAALAQVSQVPAFNGFMKKNSFIAGLLGVPPGYETEQAVDGLQTRSQVMAMIQSKIGSSSAGAASLQNSINTAKASIEKLQDKLSKLGGGSSGTDIPDFKPSDQHSKTFFNRLQYGFNFQTTSGTAYYPNYSDLGLSLGYNLGHSNSVGIGASYKLGLGTGWQHIAFSSQGVGLRSWVDIHVKKSWSAVGGFELNYVQPFSSFKDISQLNQWTRSGLIGIEKTVSLKSTVLKKTHLQLLWDFLSYSQTPKTPPVIFRVGYGF